MIYIITGDEEFLIKEKAKELIDNLNQESQLNVDHINGENINYQELLNQISNTFLNLITSILGIFEITLFYIFYRQIRKKIHGKL